MAAENNMHQKKTILSIQAIRAIACVIIYIYHAIQEYPLGEWGVSVFFILSGFVMTLSYWDRPIEATGKNAFLFSLKKIKPLFFLHVLMLIFGLVREILILNKEWHIAIMKLFVTVPLLQTWLPVGYQSLNSVDWYLSVTLFLYFAFPFILIYLRKNQPATSSSVALIVLIFIIQLIVAAMVGNCFPKFTKWFTYCFPLFRLGDFFIGCVLGHIFRNTQPSKMGRAKATFWEVIIVLAIVSSLVLARTTLKNYKWLTYTCLFIPSSAGLIYVFAKEAGLLSKLITNRVTLYFASLSAYFFLIHLQVLHYVDYAVKCLFSVDMNRWIHAIVAFPVTLLVVVLYRALENQGRNRRSLAGRQST